MILALLGTVLAADEGYKQPPTIALVLPLGVPQFTQRRPGAGAAFLAVQGVGIGLASYSSVEMWRAVALEDIDAERNWRMASMGGVALGVGGWFGSALEGSRYNDVHGRQMYANAVAWEAAQAGL